MDFEVWEAAGRTNGGGYSEAGISVNCPNLCGDNPLGANAGRRLDPREPKQGDEQSAQTPWEKHRSYCACKP
jgi:hypothetical protein